MRPIHIAASIQRTTILLMLPSVCRQRRPSAPTMAVAVLVVCMLASGLTNAQPAPSTRIVAKLVTLQGNVLISQEEGMVAAVNEQKLALGTHVVTTAGSRVTVSYDKG